MAKATTKLFEPREGERYQKKEQVKLNKDTILYLLFGFFIGLTWLGTLVSLISEPQPPISWLGGWWWISLGIAGLVALVVYPLVCLFSKENVIYRIHYNKDEEAWEEVEVERGGL